MQKISEIGGRRVPFLRWSVWRTVLGVKHLTTHWQVGDGREQALADHVTATASPGDLDDAIRAVDDFCYRESVMMNVGDEKGELLDAAIRRTEPSRLLELGTYCGYSASHGAGHDGGSPSVLDRVPSGQRADRGPHPRACRRRGPGHRGRGHPRRRR